MRYWQPVWAKTTASHSLPHPENEPQQSINNFWSRILGNQGITQISELITDLSTALIGKNEEYSRRTLDSRINDIANCKTCKK